jgi:periplasmic protein TonB
MNKIFSIFFLVLMVVFANNAVGQVADDEVFTIVEVSPEYPGGQAALTSFLSSNLLYPDSARIAGVQGTVYVTFVVEPDGQVTNARILRGIHPDCDAEVLRVVGMMPAWKPGMQRGKPVRVQFNLPVRFKL